MTARVNPFLSLSCAAQRVYLNMEDGYILEYDGKRHAFIEDEESDEGWLRIPVAVARELIAAGCVGEWRQVGIYDRPYTTYRLAHELMSTHYAKSAG